MPAGAVATVVITYYEPRLPLLDRCLYLLRESTVGLEIILADNGDAYNASDKDPRLDLVLKVKPKGQPQSPNRSFLAGFRAATTDYIIHSPPELLAPRDAVERMLAGHQPGHRDVPIFLGLDRATTERLDSLPWREDLSCLQRVPRFWQYWSPLYMSNADGRWCNWHLNFSGATRAEWLRFGVLPDTGDGGLNENWLAEQEAKASCVPILSPVEVYHQWHGGAGAESDNRRGR